MKIFLCSVKMIVSAGLIGMALMGCTSMATKDGSATSDTQNSMTPSEAKSEASRKLHMGY